MSKTDTHLIIKIAEVLQMLPECYEISAILEQYRKDNNPEPIFHKLSDYEEKRLLSQIELSDEEDGVDGEIKSDKDNYFYWLSIGDNFSFQVRNLRSLKKVDLWEDGRAVYAIRLNEVNMSFTTTSFPHPNTDVKFFSELLRDREWDRIKKRLSCFTFVRFL